MTEDANKLKKRLRTFGFSDPAITAAWPNWWSDDAENSASARNELRFSLARKLGLEPRSLLEEEEPRFVWHDIAKFKRFSGETNLERAAISSFGMAVTRSLIAATQPGRSIEGLPAEVLRNSILETGPFVGLADLLASCWGLGVPVVHLRVFPLIAKRMCAMSVRMGDRFAILLGKDANYPAPVSYYLAHELGHGALGHLSSATALVDFDDPLEGARDEDPEELAADSYALQLLTGMPSPVVTTETKRFTARQLAENVLTTAKYVHIEPGTLALCFGYSTGDWAKAHAALKFVYSKPQPVWLEVNQIALQQLDWSALPEEMAFFLRAVMGGLPHGEGSSR